MLFLLLHFALYLFFRCYFIFLFIFIYFLFSFTFYFFPFILYLLYVYIFSFPFLFSLFLYPMEPLFIRSITPSKFKYLLSDPMTFNIVMDCKEQVDDVEIEVIYGVISETEEFDQKLFCGEVGPFPVGRICFDIDVDPVNIREIPEKHLFGVTSLLVNLKYKNQIFSKVGYFVNVEYPGVPNEELVMDEVIMEDDYTIEGGSDAEEEEDGDMEEMGEFVEKDDDEEELVEEENKDEKDGENVRGYKEISEQMKEEGLVESKFEKDNYFVEEEKSKDEEVHSSSFEEVQEELEKEVDKKYGEDEKDVTEEDKLVINNYIFNMKKIQAELSDPPIITSFQINWTGEEITECEEFEEICEEDNQVEYDENMDEKDEDDGEKEKAKVKIEDDASVKKMKNQ
ncbi:ASF1 anti-silencing function 1 like protein [Spraguea lophii 42_110]|uniref:Anti-silencing function protein 1 n=1 Tax=Spraguea lophii (strain 42_110) TaxID=1358809 RepID=S7XHZ4_SPRLO|nr:ASF1 anti-silencing function 1 like protein [Spraguea lophii 42_110]